MYWRDYSSRLACPGAPHPGHAVLTSRTRSSKLPGTRNNHLGAEAKTPTLTARCQHAETAVVSDIPAAQRRAAPLRAGRQRSIRGHHFGSRAAIRASSRRRPSGARTRRTRIPVPPAGSAGSRQSAGASRRTFSLPLGMMKWRERSAARAAGNVELFRKRVEKFVWNRRGSQLGEGASDWPALTGSSFVIRDREELP